MSILVEQQDETINAIETTAGGVEKDVEQGFVHIYSWCRDWLMNHCSEFSLNHADKAVVSARAARKKRWICFAIIVSEYYSTLLLCWI
jgi:syntaxin 1B/2/3